MTSYRSLSLIPTFSNYLPDRITQMDRLFSVPGYSQDELEISVHNHQITISGKASDEKNESEDEKEGVKWLHQGISKSIRQHNGFIDLKSYSYFLNVRFRTVGLQTPNTHKYLCV